MQHSDRQQLILIWVVCSADLTDVLHLLLHHNCSTKSRTMSIQCASTTCVKLAVSTSPAISQPYNCSLWENLLTSNTVRLYIMTYSFRLLDRKYRQCLHEPACDAKVLSNSSAKQHNAKIESRFTVTTNAVWNLKASLSVLVCIFM